MIALRSKCIKAKSDKNATIVQNSVALSRKPSVDQISRLGRNTKAVNKARKRFSFFKVSIDKLVFFFMTHKNMKATINAIKNPYIVAVSLIALRGPNPKLFIATDGKIIARDE